MTTDREPASAQARRRLGDVLLAAGVVTDAQIGEALAASTTVKGRRERLGETLVRLGIVSDTDIAEALASQLRLEFRAALPDVDERVATLVPRTLAERHRCLAFAREDDGTVLVACADPTNVVATDDLRVAIGGRRIRVVVAAQRVIDTALRKAYTLEQQTGELLERIDAEHAADERDEEGADAVSDAPVIRLAHDIIVDAIGARASDIHIEPGRAETAVRFRIDGVLTQVMTVPRAATGPLGSRVKLMAGMDIAERRRPQDGRIRFRARAAEVDLRVSCMPAMHGEVLVIRILRKGDERLAVADIGFGDQQLARVLSTIERPQGLVLLTGPTGAGKTSTLYAFLAHLADQTRNLITIEDPVEYQVAGVNQTQVNDRISLTFARALRSILRQDPDVVMVGEIRDLETAELALQASLTGHMVLSTLHTNDAPSAIVRLRDLGMPPYLIASALAMVIAQRLVRAVCPSCAVRVAPTAQQIARLNLTPDDVAAGAAGRPTERGQTGWLAGTGCPECNHTGYLGRTALLEVLTVDSAVRELISSGGSEAAITHAARQAGLRSLREDGLDKAARGLTTLDEVLRVTTASDVQADTCPTCGELVAEHFNHCPWCAASLRPAACRGCDRPMERGWRACPSCGSAVAGVEPGQAVALPRVLVVDDDASVRAAITAIIGFDYEVVQAADADSALAAVAAQRVDAVVLDVTLPDVDGYELTRRLRARPATMALPILLVTGSDDPQVELDGLRAGADDYLTKPLEPDVLLARLDAARRRASLAAV